MPPKVQNCPLTNLLSKPFGGDNAKGEVGFPRGSVSCLGLANKHSARIPDLRKTATPYENCMALHIRKKIQPADFTGNTKKLRSKISKFDAESVKYGLGSLPAGDKG